jgi:anthranilate phosphoribosyltransferase
MSFKELFERIENGHDLTMEESAHAVESMMLGSWEAAQTAVFLKALHAKGETAEEVAGFATTMRQASVKIPLEGVDTMDTCGTGGDKKGSFNISTLAAFVLAGTGIPIAKHGNRAASSACGSADLLHALGIRYRLHPEEAAEAVTEIGFAFLFAPDYHPATRSVAEIRKQLNSPTIFNLLGPLTNPAFPKAQLIGVYKRSALSILTEAIRNSNPELRAALIHGEQGWDEATPCCNFLIHYTSGKIESLNAEQLGIEPCSENQLYGGSPVDNARIAEDILDGKPGPQRQTVLLNALLGYRVYYPESTPEEALKKVTQSLNSGAARDIVAQLKQKFPGETA